MQFDFDHAALEFVRRNNCAADITKQLVKKAMEEAAAEAVRQFTDEVKSITAELVNKQK